MASGCDLEIPIDQDGQRETRGRNTETHNTSTREADIQTERETKTAERVRVRVMTGQNLYSAALKDVFCCGKRQERQTHLRECGNIRSTLRPEQTVVFSIDPNQGCHANVSTQSVLQPALRRRIARQPPRHVWIRWPYWSRWGAYLPGLAGARACQREQDQKTEKNNHCPRP